MLAVLVHVSLLLRRLGIILLLYILCRLLFYAFNASLFPSVTAFDILKALFYGLRFDISAIIYTNVLFILLHIIPHPWRGREGYQRVLKSIFYLFNVPILLLAVSDFIYFRYTMKRTTADILGITKDIVALLPQYIKDFWYLLLILLALLMIAEWLYRKTQYPIPSFQEFGRQPISGEQSRDRLGILNCKLGGVVFGLAHWFIFIIVIVVCLIGARGGIQLRPITPMSALLNVDVSLAPLVTNTPFTFLYSLEHRALQEKNYFSMEELDTLYSIYHQPWQDKPFRPLNVMLIVLEGFSREYIGALNHGKGYTPFLDELIADGLVYTNAFANGTQSHQGIVAITASLPALMHTPFHISIYQNNRFNGIGTLLKRKGYRTAFFHGGNNGTMGFDSYSKAAGFDHYYGRSEYANDADYDGVWGIYDEPFFQYTAHKLNEYEQPFCALLFSLTSHHPFKLPPEYEEKFKSEKLPLYRTIRYTDYALRQFFETARQMPWYNNTLFIITADHSSLAEADFYKNRVGSYAIPLLFYYPNGELRGVDDRLVQQVDILPSLLDFLHYDEPFCAFGNSVLDTLPQRYVFQLAGNIYQIVSDSLALFFDGEKALGLYNYRTDLYFQNNLMSQRYNDAVHMERYLKAVIQRYHDAMIHNRLVP